jgi:hypothetical protein
MRHLGTLTAAIVTAPFAWILLAFGQDRSVRAFAGADGDGAFHSGDFLRPVLCLAAAGILFGLIGTLRFSPLGAVLTGVGYSISYLVLLINPQRVVDLFPHRISVLGRSADPITPLRTGTTLILGALLLVAVASVGRWRRWPAADSAATGHPDGIAPTTPARDYASVGADGYGPASRPGISEPALVTGRATDNEGPASNVSHWIASLHSDFDGGRPRPDRPEHAARPAPDRQVGYPGDPRGRATDGWRTARRS